MRSIPIFLVLMVALILLSDDRRGSESCCFGKPKTLSAQTETTNPPRPITQQPMPQKDREEPRPIKQQPMTQKDREEPPSLDEEKKKLIRDWFADLEKITRIKPFRQTEQMAKSRLIADYVGGNNNYFEQCCKENYITNGQHFDLYWLTRPDPTQVDGKTVQCEADSNGNVQFGTIFPILKFLKDKKLNQDFTYRHADVAKFAEISLETIKNCKEKLHCAEFAKCMLQREVIRDLQTEVADLRRKYKIIREEPESY